MSSLQEQFGPIDIYLFDQLLRGRRGAARLSLETGAPVVPMGIRFPGIKPGHRIQDHAVMELCIGAPLVPPAPVHEPASLDTVTHWHAAIMSEIAEVGPTASWRSCCSTFRPMPARSERAP